MRARTVTGAEGTVTARRSGDGWLLNGRRALATMAPATTTLQVLVAYQDAVGEDRVGTAFVPAGAPGVELQDGWRAPVLRAAASGYASFDDARIADGALRDVGAPDEVQAWGQAS